ncbi:MAG: amino acid transporter [Ralstonia sp.]|nr:amino acid transporter [Ralstonia sp.]POH90029.1 amino acid transporter [Ralstonia pickettii]MBA4231891.1 amino acid transporter [Ralstonia sp.]MBA4237432.1 amino acid transporter [Ralstonia sp.]MBA4280272.1 amino acid transporter [Ralstonia sp.]
MQESPTPGCVAGLGSAGKIDTGGLDIRYAPNLRKGPNDVGSTVIGPHGTFVR